MSKNENFELLEKIEQENEVKTKFRMKNENYFPKFRMKNENYLPKLDESMTQEH